MNPETPDQMVETSQTAQSPVEPLPQPEKPLETPATPPAPPENKSKKKLFIIAGIVVAIFILTAIAVFAYMQMQGPSDEVMTEASPSPSPEAMMENEMSDWETYINQTYSYSLKVPSGWEHFRQGGDDSVISLRPAGVEEIPISITAQPNNEGLTAEDIVKNQTSEIQKDAVFNDIQYVYYVSDVSPFSSKVYITINDPNYYQLTVSTLKQEYVAIFDQILSTFRFDSGL
jgi:hypothetical protein